MRTVHADTETRDRKRPWWVVSTYFTEGLPYAIVRPMSTVFFKDAGASLQAIGLTSLYGLPWTLKFLWAPLVDTFATKRRWLVCAQVALTGLIVALAAASALRTAVAAAAVVFLIMAVVAATNDIAVDGYYLEGLDRRDQARFVGFQAMAYRIAMIAGTGGIVAFSYWTSWPAGFALAAVIFGLLALVHAVFLPHIEQAQRPAAEMLRMLLRPVVAAVLGCAVLVVVGVRELASLPALEGLRTILGRVSAPGWIVIVLFLALAVLAARAPQLKRRLYASSSTYALAFVDYLDQPRVGLILAFIALYRTGESFLLNMAYPFLADIGVNRADYGLAYGTFGVAAAIVAGLVGGALIARWGLRRCIWPFVVAQNLLNLLYMFMAWHYRGIFRHPELGRADVLLVTVLIVVEQFGAGLGTAALMVFIQRTTKPAFKAAHFAIGTGLSTISATLAGVLSGFIAAALGFTFYFGLTFLATLPAMTLIPFLPHLDGPPAVRKG